MNRFLVAHTPLPPDELKALTLQGTEEIGKLFDFQISMLSPNHSIPMDDLLGQSITYEIELQTGGKRYLDGIVTECSQAGRRGSNYVYTARLQPRLALLDKTRDYRIFQHMTGPQICKQILQEYGVVVEDRLTGQYRNREYCVQYRESAFNFISRLLEDEGATYHFEHSLHGHTMVLTDSMSAFKPLPEYEEIPYFPESMAAIPDQEFIWHIATSKKLDTGIYVSDDYVFKGTRDLLDVTQPMVRKHPSNRLRFYDYPGGYRVLSDGERLARIRIEQLQYLHQKAECHGNARGIAPGYIYSQTRFPRKDENGSRLIVKSIYDLQNNAYEAGQSAEEVVHDISFVTTPTSEPFRPPRTTPIPKAHSPDNAVVVGPPGAEIWCDPHSRVRVQFEWDQYGKRNLDSSCLIRVVSPWAEERFGMISIPRVGSAVLVQYIDGNPDHPIITGRLYTAQQMPPWELPANMTQTGILTRSSQGGGYDNANALRFEDKKGSEELWIHAEKDQRIEVEHDESHWVGHDRVKNIDHDETNHIKHDRTSTIDHDETVIVHGKRTEVVDGNEDITIHSNRTERVDMSEKIDIGDTQKLTVGSTRTKNVRGNENNSISRNQSVSVGMNKTETVKFMAMENVGIAKVESIGAGYMLNVGAAWMSTVGFLHQHNVGMTYKIKVGKTMDTSVGKKLSIKVGSGGGEGGGNAGLTSNIVAPSGGEKKDDGGSEILMDADSITLRVGKSSLVLKKDGTATLSADMHIQLASERVDLN